MEKSRQFKCLLQKSNLTSDNQISEDVEHSNSVDNAHIYSARASTIDTSVGSAIGGLGSGFGTGRGVSASIGESNEIVGGTLKRLVRLDLMSAFKRTIGRLFKFAGCAKIKRARKRRQSRVGAMTGNSTIEALDSITDINNSISKPNSIDTTSNKQIEEHKEKTQVAQT